MSTTLRQARLTIRAQGLHAVEGDLTFGSVAALWPQGVALLRQGVPLELDLSGVGLADSAGLALLVAWQAQARAEGCPLRYASVPERLLAISRISEADSLLGG
ncbi:MAG: hypothetical protein RLZZ393_567 [Pseudomonadota bacterium]|jgi:phospholipid transport system transporter-binding protein